MSNQSEGDSTTLAMSQPVNPATDRSYTNASDATSHFGLSFLKQMSDDTKENLVISPLSLQTAFSMLLLGAADDSATQHELSKVLGYQQPRLAPDNSLSEPDRLHPHQSLRQILNTIMASTGATADSGAPVEFSLSNLLLTREALIELNPDYQQGLKEFYEAELEDFQSVSGTPLHVRINNWVSDKTKGMIGKLVSEEDVSDPLLLAVVLNAVYFKASWQNEFSKRNTRDQPFYNQAGIQLEVPFMRETGLFHYVNMGNRYEFPLSKLDCSVLSVPFSPNSGNELSMVFILPSELDGIDGLQQELDLHGLNEIYKSLVHRTVQVELPKFTLECSHEGGDTMKRMGLVRVFKCAQLDRMLSENSELIKRGMGVKVDKVIHKAKIVVDEVGAEAAAATTILVGATITSAGFNPPPPPKFIADHPFLFIIRHHSSNMPLFMGRLSTMKSAR